MTKYILLTFIVLAATGCQASSDPIEEQVGQHLADIIQNANVDIQNNPVRSSKCFDTYMPQLNTLTTVYEAAHAQCLETAAKASDAVLNEVQPKITEVSQLNANICSGFSKCQINNSDPYAFFECSNAAAVDASSMSYNVQTISKDRMQYISLRTQMITYDKTTCTDKCSQTYVEDTSKIHAELQDCLAGKIQPEYTTAYTPGYTYTATVSTTTYD